jgi:hypothetical protein
MEIQRSTADLRIMLTISAVAESLKYGSPFLHRDGEVTLAVHITAAVVLIPWGLTALAKVS